MIEFRIGRESDLWMRFWPPVPDPLAFVADRNNAYGWTKYRFVLIEEKKS